MINQFVKSVGVKESDIMTVAGVGGRPLKYETVEKLQTAIDEYFDSCYITELDKEKKPYRVNVRPLTVSGLAVALDMTRQMLVEYSSKDEFGDTIKKAKQIIEQWAEENLVTARNPAGQIFSLKNNYGWQDKQEIILNDKRVLFEGEDKLED